VHIVEHTTEVPAGQLQEDRQRFEAAALELKILTAPSDESARRRAYFFVAAESPVIHDSFPSLALAHSRSSTQ
jgi:hypothetical protein